MALKKWPCLFLVSIAAIHQAMAKDLNVSRESECISVRPEHPVRQSFRITKPGRYCVVEDFDQRWVFTLPHTDMPFPFHTVLSVADDVELNLRGHKLRSNPPLWHTGLDVGMRTVVENGTIEVMGGLPISGGGLKSTGNILLDLKIPEKEAVGSIGPISLSGGDLGLYPDTELVFENLAIRTNHTAIVLQGKKNVIRNCHIEGGNNTLLLYGPNLKLLNNTIVLNSRDPELYAEEIRRNSTRFYPIPSAYVEAARQSEPVAVWLEDADNALVSGNTIIVKGSAKEPQAIAITNSKNVRILENNVIKGAAKPYQLRDAVSSALSVPEDPLEAEKRARHDQAIAQAVAARDFRVREEQQRAETYTQELLQAISKRDRMAFDRLLSKSGDLSRAAATGAMQGDTPLIAVLSDKATFAWVQAILNRNVNVSLANRYGVTALMLAAGEGNTRLLAELLRQGAEINATNKDGATALIYAVSAGALDAVKLLLRAGANPNLSKKDGTTALAAARQQHFPEIVRALEQVGAR